MVGVSFFIGLGVLLVVTLIVVAGLSALDRWSRPGVTSGTNRASGGGAFASPEEDPASADFVSLPAVARGFDLDRSFADVAAAVPLTSPPMLVGGWLMVLAQCGGNGNGGGSSSGDDEVEEFIEGLFGWIEEGSSIVIAQASSSPFDGFDFSSPGLLMAAVFAGLGFLALCGLIQLALYAWIAPGFARLQVTSLTQGEISFNTLFGGLDRFVDMFAWRLLRWVVISVPILLVVFAPVATTAALDLSAAGWGDAPAWENAPAWESWAALGALGGVVGFGLFLWLAPAMALGNYFVALDGANPVLALRRSVDAARGQRIPLILFAFVWSLATGLFAVFGVLLLCVGLLITLPIAVAALESAWVRGYLLARDGYGSRDTWSVHPPSGHV